MSRKVPRLRFKEFSGEWEEKKLEDIGEFRGGGTPTKKIKEYWQGQIPWISSSDIEEDNIYNIYIHRFITEVALKKSATKIIPKNSILFVSRVGVGKLAINDQELCTSQDFINFIPKGINIFYLGYYFQGNKNILTNFNQGTSIKGFTKDDQIKKEAQGAKVLGISAKRLSNIKLFFPKDPNEQQKIANTLSSLDNLIEAGEKKIEALKKHKIGLMQQLFPQEGEKTPKLRFKEFSGEWKEKKLGELANRYDNLRIPVTQQDRIKGNTPYYGANGIQDYVQGFTHDGEFVLVAEDGANDLNNYPVFYVKGEIWVNNHAHVLQAKKNIADNIFLMYSLKNINMEPYLVGGGRAKLNANVMMQINLFIPKLNEQQKIANTLSSLDNLIEAGEKKIKALKRHKKGLMQQMFVSEE